jgi:hypothetical protein
MSIFKIVLRTIMSVVLLSVSAVCAGATALGAGPSDLPRRLAIVVGNSAYESTRLEHLQNAVNDATRLSESLKRLNFDVLTTTNVTSEAFNRLLVEAETRLPAASAVLIFYAGHGIQINGENYLLPVDTPDPDSVDKLTQRAIKLNDVVARFASRDRQTFVFLDACRDNPMGQGGGNDGLAQVEVGENTFIAFATQPGNATVDGAGENSPFTTALLKNIEIPGLSVSDMMIRVRNETEALTLGRQVPWDQSNLREQFYFTEQQVIDPAQLSASLSRILSDPVAKEKLQIELASNDLQTAVLIVGQALRSVSPSAVQIGAEPPGAPGIQVASLEASRSIEGARRSVVADLGTLIVGAPTTKAGGEAQTAELARSVQTELRRLGCYRMAVDGDWGKGSVRALNDFYKNTRQVAATAEPTVELLGDLFLRSGRICKQPVVVKKPRQTNIASDDGRKAISGSKRNRKSRALAAPARAPAAPPPDISSGIGIGGVF